jgi:hypothetical protein
MPGRIEGLRARGSRNDQDIETTVLLDHVFQRRGDRSWVLRVEGDAVGGMPRRGDRGGPFSSKPLDNRPPDKSGATDHQRDVTAQSEIHVDEANSAAASRFAEFTGEPRKLLRAQGQRPSDNHRMGPRSLRLMTFGRVRHPRSAAS